MIFRDGIEPVPYKNCVHIIFMIQFVGFGFQAGPFFFSFCCSLTFLILTHMVAYNLFLEKHI